MAQYQFDDPGERQIAAIFDYLHDSALAYLAGERLRLSLTVLQVADAGWISEPCDALRNAARAAQAARAAAVAAQRRRIV